MTNQDEQAERQVVELDCRVLDAQQLSAELQSISSGSQVILKSPADARHGLAAGLDVQVDFQVDGSLGDFALMLAASSNWDVRGDVGAAFGHSLVSAKVLVRGSAGDNLGAFAQGGFIAVHGRAENGVAYSLGGGEILVRSRVGDYAGAFMTDGVLVLANGAGQKVGFGLTGGNIFIRGEVASLAPELRKVRMKDTDAMRLSLLLARAKIRGEAREFKLYQAKIGATQHPGTRK